MASGAMRRFALLALGALLLTQLARAQLYAPADGPISCGRNMCNGMATYAEAEAVCAAEEGARLCTAEEFAASVEDYSCTNGGRTEGSFWVRQAACGSGQQGVVDVATVATTSLPMTWCNACYMSAFLSAKFWMF